MHAHQNEVKRSKFRPMQRIACFHLALVVGLACASLIPGTTRGHALPAISAHHARHGDARPSISPHPAHNAGVPRARTDGKQPRDLVSRAAATCGEPFDGLEL
jgi:hypothetical protein